MSQQEQIIDMLPSDSEVTLLDRLTPVFGTDGAREILRMLKGIILRRISSIISWSNWYLAKIDIAGIKLRVSFTRFYTDTMYELTVRVTIEDVDPPIIKKNIKTLYRMMKPDSDQERVLTQLESIVLKHIREEEGEDEDSEGG